MTAVITAAPLIAWAGILVFGVFYGWPVIIAELRKERRRQP